MMDAGTETTSICDGAGRDREFGNQQTRTRDGGRPGPAQGRPRARTRLVDIFAVNPQPARRMQLLVAHLALEMPALLVREQHLLVHELPAEARRRACASPEAPRRPSGMLPAKCSWRAQSCDRSRGSLAGSASGSSAPVAVVAEGLAVLLFLPLLPPNHPAAPEDLPAGYPRAGKTRPLLGPAYAGDGALLSAKQTNEIVAIAPPPKHLAGRTVGPGTALPDSGGSI